MRIYTFLFTFLLVFTACGDPDSDRQDKVSKAAIEEPADLIPQDKMIQVMADVHLLEASLQFRSPHPPSRQPFSITPVQEIPQSLPSDQKSLPYYDIFAKYGYTHDQYQRSLEWYSMDPLLFGEMYDEVINELVLRQAKAQSGTQTVKVPVDSAK